MARRFLDGLSFGAGFAISFLSIWYAASFLMGPRLVASQLEELNRQSPAVFSEPAGGKQEATSPSSPVKPFYDLSVDDQIRQSTVIAIARYEKAPDGKMKAVIKEFLKKTPGAESYYNVGDEFALSSYYPKDGDDHGDGAIIFFTGSPAHMAMSVSFSGDRVSGLGDLPLALLRAKCTRT